MGMINTRQGKGENSNRVFNLSISDTNTHDFPDTDGDDSDGGDPFSGENIDDLAVKIHNNQDQDLTATLEMTNYEDKAFDAFDTDTETSSITVSSGGGTETLVADPDTPFDWYRVTLSFGSTPSGNNDTTVVFMTNEHGDNITRA